MNPWDAFEELEHQYGNACSSERWASVAHQMKQTGETACRWREAREVKARLYVAMVKARDAAIKSGVEYTG